ncbi:hypothetical protein C2869_12085 [Saccharobesus litoralis]|uniref:Uncharacterized protein n=1 Tax=Saccharobesus litoralis TaxID=2172099 RepID=A0A2S0VSF1_9ALTE|nr:hypothetical protein [Saccharobesus litoralis]AWB67127.1 hypothetical protein C2869_12085 [Saccharobesus litoralis]
MTLQDELKSMGLIDDSRSNHLATNELDEYQSMLEMTMNDETLTSAAKAEIVDLLIRLNSAPK